MIRHILFIHSAGNQGLHEGSSDFIAFLVRELGDDFHVHNPKMPDPDNPSYALWKKKVHEELSATADNAILIGHSLGGSVLLKYLSEHEYRKPIAALFLVAVPYWGKEGWYLEEFMLRDDFAMRLPKIPQLFLYHSIDDEVVPFRHLKAYAHDLPQARLRVLKGNEHSFSDGLPELVNDLKKLNVKEERLRPGVST